MKMCVCMLAVIWFLSVLTAIFQVDLGQTVFTEAKDDGGDNWTTGAISRAKLQSDHHHQQTNIQFFYRPDALHVAQTTVSKHWGEKLFDFRKTHSFFLVTLNCEEVATEIQQPQNGVIIEHKAKNEHWLGVTRWWANNIKWNDVTRHNLELLLLFLFNSHFPRQPG